MKQDFTRSIVSIFYVFLGLALLISCGGGGGSDSATAPATAYQTEALTSIETQTGDPMYAGFDLQFRQGDYWLYDWTDVYTSRGLVKDPFTGLYPWNTTTKTGTVRLTLGTPQTILGITFFQVITEYTGDAQYVKLPWSSIASFNNKIYGYRDDGVYLIFDAQNGTWKGGSFFSGASNKDVTGPAGTFSISRDNATGQCSVLFPDKGINIGVGMSMVDYFSPYIGPVKYDMNYRADTYHGEETLVLSGSSKNPPE